MRELIFVDTESTGLASDPEAKLVELTWARRTGEPQTLWFGVKEVPGFIDDLIGFTKRGISGRISTYPEIERFLSVSSDSTMVAANPGHDKSFLERTGLWRFHYRMLDIESYAMAKLNLPQMPSMKDIFDELKDYTNLTEPDHTSRNDVLAMREAFLFLEDM